MKPLSCILFVIIKIISLSEAVTVYPVTDTSVDNLVLLKVLQSVDAAANDEHLFDITVKLLQSVCKCMLRTLREKTDDTNSIELQNIEKEDVQKELDIYRSVYNETCLNLRQDSRSISKTHFRRENYEQNLNFTEEGDSNDEYLDHAANEPDPKRLALQNIFYKLFIETKDLHTYNVQRYSLFNKNNNLVQKHLQHGIILILTLHPSNSTNRKDTDYVSIDDNDLNQTLYSQSNIDIDIIDTKYDVKGKSNEKLEDNNKKQCTLKSIYTFLIQNERKNRTKVSKLLRRKGTIKVYVNVRIKNNHQDYSKLCCFKSDDPICNDDLFKKPPSMKGEAATNIKSNLRETISKIISLVKFYSGRQINSKSDVTKRSRTNDNDVKLFSEECLSSTCLNKTLQSQLHSNTKTSNSIDIFSNKNEKEIDESNLETEYLKNTLKSLAKVITTVNVISLKEKRQKSTPTYQSSSIVQKDKKYEHNLNFDTKETETSQNSVRDNVVTLSINVDVATTNSIIRNPFISKITNVETSISTHAGKNIDNSHLKNGTTLSDFSNKELKSDFSTIQWKKDEPETETISRYLESDTKIRMQPEHFKTFSAPENLTPQISQEETNTSLDVITNIKIDKDPQDQHNNYVTTTDQNSFQNNRSTKNIFLVNTTPMKGTQNGSNSISINTLTTPTLIDQNSSTAYFQTFDITKTLLDQTTLQEKQMNITKEMNFHQNTKHQVHTSQVIDSDRINPITKNTNSKLPLKRIVKNTGRNKLIIISTGMSNQKNKEKIFNKNSIILLEPKNISIKLNNPIRDIIDIIQYNTATSKNIQSNILKTTTIPFDKTSKKVSSIKDKINDFKIMSNHMGNVNFTSVFIYTDKNIKPKSFVTLYKKYTSRKRSKRPYKLKGSPILFQNTDDFLTTPIKQNHKRTIPLYDIDQSTPLKTRNNTLLTTGKESKSFEKDSIHKPSTFIKGDSKQSTITTKRMNPYKQDKKKKIMRTESYLDDVRSTPYELEAPIKNKKHTDLFNKSTLSIKEKTNSSATPIHKIKEPNTIFNKSLIEHTFGINKIRQNISSNSKEYSTTYARENVDLDFNLIKQLDSPKKYNDKSSDFQESSKTKRMTKSTISSDIVDSIVEFKVEMKKYPDTKRLISLNENNTLNTIELDIKDSKEFYILTTKQQNLGDDVKYINQLNIKKDHRFLNEDVTHKNRFYNLTTNPKSDYKLKITNNAKNQTSLPKQDVIFSKGKTLNKPFFIEINKDEEVTTLMNTIISTNDSDTNITMTKTLHSFYPFPTKSIEKKLTVGEIKVTPSIKIMNEKNNNNERTKFDKSVNTYLVSSLGKDKNNVTNQIKRRFVKSDFLYRNTESSKKEIKSVNDTKMVNNELNSLERYTRPAFLLEKSSETLRDSNISSLNEIETNTISSNNEPHNQIIKMNKNIDTKKLFSSKNEMFLKTKNSLKKLNLNKLKVALTEHDHDTKYFNNVTTIRAIDDFSTTSIKLKTSRTVDHWIERKYTNTQSKPDMISIYQESMTSTTKKALQVNANLTKPHTLKLLTATVLSPTTTDHNEDNFPKSEPLITNSIGRNSSQLINLSSTESMKEIKILSSPKNNGQIEKNHIYDLAPTSPINESGTTLDDTVTEKDQNDKSTSNLSLYTNQNYTPTSESDNIIEEKGLINNIGVPEIEDKSKKSKTNHAPDILNEFFNLTDILQNNKYLNTLSTVFYDLSDVYENVIEKSTNKHFNGLNHSQESQTKNQIYNKQRQQPATHLAENLKISQKSLTDDIISIIDKNKISFSAGNNTKDNYIRSFLVFSTKYDEELLKKESLYYLDNMPTKQYSNDLYKPQSKTSKDLATEKIIVKATPTLDLSNKINKPSKTSNMDNLYKSIVSSFAINTDRSLPTNNENTIYFQAATSPYIGLNTLEGKTSKKEIVLQPTSIKKSSEELDIKTTTLKQSLLYNNTVTSVDFLTPEIRHEDYRKNILVEVTFPSITTDFVTNKKPQITENVINKSKNIQNIHNNIVPTQGVNSGIIQKKFGERTKIISNNNNVTLTSIIKSIKDFESSLVNKTSANKNINKASETRLKIKKQDKNVNGSTNPNISIFSSNLYYVSDKILKEKDQIDNTLSIHDFNNTKPIEENFKTGRTKNISSSTESNSQVNFINGTIPLDSTININKTFLDKDIKLNSVYYLETTPIDTHLKITTNKPTLKMPEAKLFPEIILSEKTIVKTSQTLNLLMKTTNQSKLYDMNKLTKPVTASYIAKTSSAINNENSNYFNTLTEIPTTSYEVMSLLGYKASKNKINPVSTKSLNNGPFIKTTNVNKKLIFESTLMPRSLLKTKKIHEKHTTQIPEVDTITKISEFVKNKPMQTTESFTELNNIKRNTSSQILLTDKIYQDTEDNFVTPVVSKQKGSIFSPTLKINLETSQKMFATKILNTHGTLSLLKKPIHDSDSSLYINASTDKNYDIPSVTNPISMQGIMEEDKNVTTVKSPLILTFASHFYNERTRNFNIETTKQENTSHLVGQMANLGISSTTSYFKSHESTARNNTLLKKYLTPVSWASKLHSTKPSHFSSNKTELIQKKYTESLKTRNSITNTLKKIKERNNVIPSDTESRQLELYTSIFEFGTKRIDNDKLNVSLHKAQSNTSKYLLTTKNVIKTPAVDLHTKIEERSKPSNVPKDLNYFNKSFEASSIVNTEKNLRSVIKDDNINYLKPSADIPVTLYITKNQIENETPKNNIFLQTTEVNSKNKEPVLKTTKYVRKLLLNTTLKSKHPLLLEIRGKTFRDHLSHVNVSINKSKFITKEIIKPTTSIIEFHTVSNNTTSSSILLTDTKYGNENENISKTQKQKEIRQNITRNLIVTENSEANSRNFAKSTKLTKQHSQVTLSLSKKPPNVSLNYINAPANEKIYMSTVSRPISTLEITRQDTTSETIPLISTFSSYLYNTQLSYPNSETSKQETTTNLHEQKANLSVPRTTPYFGNHVTTAQKTNILLEETLTSLTYKLNPTKLKFYHSVSNEKGIIQNYDIKALKSSKSMTAASVKIKEKDDKIISEFSTNRFKNKKMNKFYNKNSFTKKIMEKTKPNLNSYMSIIEQSKTSDITLPFETSYVVNTGTTLHLSAVDVNNTNQILKASTEILVTPYVNVRLLEDKVLNNNTLVQTTSTNEDKRTSKNKFVTTDKIETTKLFNNITINTQSQILLTNDKNKKENESFNLVLKQKELHQHSEENNKQNTESEKTTKNISQFILPFLEKPSDNLDSSYYINASANKNVTLSTVTKPIPISDIKRQYKTLIDSTNPTLSVLPSKVHNVSNIFLNQKVPITSTSVPLIVGRGTKSIEETLKIKRTKSTLIPELGQQIKQTKTEQKFTVKNKYVNTFNNYIFDKIDSKENNLNFTTIVRNEKSTKKPFRKKYAQKSTTFLTQAFISKKNSIVSPFWNTTTSMKITLNKMPSHTKNRSYANNSRSILDFSTKSLINNTLIKINNKFKTRSKYNVEHAKITTHVGNVTMSSIKKKIKIFESSGLKNISRLKPIFLKETKKGDLITNVLKSFTTAMFSLNFKNIRTNHFNTETTNLGLSKTTPHFGKFYSTTRSNNLLQDKLTSLISSDKLYSTNFQQYIPTLNKKEFINKEKDTQTLKNEINIKQFMSDIETKHKKTINSMDENNKTTNVNVKSLLLSPTTFGKYTSNETYKTISTTHKTTSKDNRYNKVTDKISVTKRFNKASNTTTLISLTALKSFRKSISKVNTSTKSFYTKLALETVNSKNITQKVVNINKTQTKKVNITKPTAVNKDFSSSKIITFLNVNSIKLPSLKINTEKMVILEPVVYLYPVNNKATVEIPLGIHKLNTLHDEPFSTELPRKENVIIKTKTIKYNTYKPITKDEIDLSVNHLPKQSKKIWKNNLTMLKADVINTKLYPVKQTVKELRKKKEEISVLKTQKDMNLKCTDTIPFIFNSKNQVINKIVRENNTPFRKPYVLKPVFRPITEKPKPFWKSVNSFLLSTNSKSNKPSHLYYLKSDKKPAKVFLQNGRRKDNLLYSKYDYELFEEEINRRKYKMLEKARNQKVVTHKPLLRDVLVVPEYNDKKPAMLRDRVESVRRFLYNSDHIQKGRTKSQRYFLQPPFEEDFDYDPPTAYYRQGDLLEYLDSEPYGFRRYVTTLTDWWCDDMYLKIRLPVVINSNPGMVFRRRNFAKMEEVADLAALFIDDLLDYKEMIDRGELPLERATSREKGQPLCMEQFYRLLGVCRIPEVGKDRIEMPRVKEEHEEQEELIVAACRNYFYPIPVKAVDRGRLTPGEIQAQLLHVMVDAAGAPPAPKVGMLTTMQRDQWAKTREQVIKDDNNRANLDLISRALCVLCLDEAGGERADVNADTNAMLMSLHGGGVQYHSANRWFDKTLQLIISSDGTIGMNFEHSAAEGVAMVRLIERALARTEVADRPAPPPTLLPAPQAMKWNLTPAVTRTIDQAGRDFERLFTNLDLTVYTYTGYGKEFMKSCRTSPDVYIQLAMQYAYYKMYHHLVSTYESASLRRFRNGRVDNIRSAHPAAKAWAAIMCTAESPANDAGDEGQRKVSFNLYGTQKKLELFEEAARKQTSIMEANIQGRGIDNHLLGLREAARETLGELPAIFTDSTYATMLDFKLSTSQVATTVDNAFCGYGPVVPDGYGCCYNPRKDSIIFVISSFKSSSVTNTEAFRLSLEEALDSMKLMFQTRSTEG